MACDSPISIKYDPPISDGKGGWIYYFPADCGKCYNCLKKRKQQWSFRMSEELRRSFSAYFITLTFEGQIVDLPWVDYHKEFIKNLKFLEDDKQLAKREEISYEELQRQRNNVSHMEETWDKEGNKSLQRAKLRYYGTIEFGDKTGRPHFHYILYNVIDRSNIALAWGRGIVHIDEANVNTIDYTLKYMMKDHDGQKNRERSWMSKGLGLHALTDEQKRHIQAPEANNVINTRGRKVGLPRYYRKKFLSEEQNEAKARYIADKVKIDQEKKEKEHGPKLGAHELSGKNARRAILLNRKKRDLNHAKIESESKSRNEQRGEINNTREDQDTT